MELDYLSIYTTLEYTKTAVSLVDGLEVFDNRTMKIRVFFMDVPDDQLGYFDFKFPMFSLENHMHEVLANASNVTRASPAETGNLRSLDLMAAVPYFVDQTRSSAFHDENGNAVLLFQCMSACVNSMCKLSLIRTRH